MVKVEFRRINSHDEDADTVIAKYDLTQVPEKGELVNLLGKPYVVFDRGWAYSHKIKGLPAGELVVIVANRNDIEVEEYAYLRCSPYSFSK